MALEILYYNKSNDPNSKTVGDFGIHIPEWDLTFNKMRLVRSSKGNLFVAGPSYKVVVNGKDTYCEYTVFGESRKRRFFDAALKEINKYIEEHCSNEPLKTMGEMNKQMEKQNPKQEDEMPW